MKKEIFAQLKNILTKEQGIKTFDYFKDQIREELKGQGRPFLKPGVFFELVNGDWTPMQKKYDVGIQEGQVQFSLHFAMPHIWSFEQVCDFEAKIFSLVHKKLDSYSCERASERDGGTTEKIWYWVVDYVVIGHQEQDFSHLQDSGNNLQLEQSGSINGNS